MPETLNQCCLNNSERQQLAKDFNITKICMRTFAGGVLEWGYGPTCEGVVEDEGAAYASLWSVKGDKTMPAEHYVTPESTAFLKTLRGDDKNFDTESFGHRVLEDLAWCRVVGRKTFQER